MATMLKVPPAARADPNPADTPSAKSGFELNPLSRDMDVLGGQNPIKDDDASRPLPVPERILVRELTVAFANTGPFVYASPDRYHQCSSMADVDVMLDAILDNAYNAQIAAAP